MSEVEKPDAIDLELLEIQEEHGGLLRPVDVVAFAKDPDTALHGRFEWDNEKASQEYRLWQARQIIRVRVTVLDMGGETISVRAYQSLPSDRAEDDGGYRSIGVIMAAPEMRRQLLESARKEMTYFRLKYHVLSELAGVFKAMGRVEGRLAGKRR